MAIQRKPKWDLRNIWEAICYVTKTGCQWRLIPENYPPWQTVCWYFRKWTLDGTIEISHQEIRKAVRKQAGKKEHCRIGIIDSSSIRMNATSGHSKGFDGNKKVNGLKHHPIVDSLGLVINVVTPAANIHDSVGAKHVFEKMLESKYDEPNLQHVFADSGYRGNLKKWLQKKLNMSLTIVKEQTKPKIGKYNPNDGLLNEHLLGC